MRRLRVPLKHGKHWLVSANAELQVERVTNHDVKAIEYVIKERFQANPELHKVSRLLIAPVMLCMLSLADTHTEHACRFRSSPTLHARLRTSTTWHMPSCCGKP